MAQTNINSPVDLKVHCQVRDSIFVELVPPKMPATQRNDVAFIAILDISGSMGEEASTNPNPSGEKDGFSRLDLVKHSMQTIGASLEDNDVVGIVTFASKAQTLLQPTKMDKKGKEKLKQVVDGMVPTDSTNIWDGLRLGYEMCRNSLCDNRNVVMVLLTDGDSNVNPKEGLLPTLKSHTNSKPNSFPPVHTFGFGYNVKSEDLVAISNMTTGTYSFIPDSSMVGTIFINFLSNMLSTAVWRADLHFGKQIFKLSNIQYGQSRQILLKKEDAGEIQVETFHPDMKLSIKVNANDSQDSFNDSISEAICRNLLCDTVERIYTSLLGQEVHSKLKDDYDKLVKTFQTYDKLEFAQLVLKDLISTNENDGQIEKALMNPEFFNKWGKHYIPSVLFAHRAQLSNNFKDNGISKYGGDLFVKFRESIEKIFISLPAPKPSITNRGPITVHRNMNRYYNVSGGCFSGATRVKCVGNGVNLQSPQIKSIQDLQKGDLIVTGPNGITFGQVLCIVKTFFNKKIELVEYGPECYITPYHPVQVDGENWIFPQNDSKQNCKKTTKYVDTLYDLVLKDSAGFMVYDKQGQEMNLKFITLGHNIKGDVVASHTYFGTNKIVEDLSRMSGWEKGTVEIHSAQFVRNSENKVCGLNANFLNFSGLLF